MSADDNTQGFMVYREMVRQMRKDAYTAILFAEPTIVSEGDE